MTATNHDNCLAALLLELTDVGLTILGGATDGVENQGGWKAGLETSGETLELVRKHGRL